ncbi:hypothetical protein FH972_021393 [Carpinus fangiana]|uniref:Uncharacterized protein n=1 Tax=Carpinus fangiana TaxID=176857 RepID=A0A5N6KPS4_9ROSI|nr:hypothetical protein FH972_021393 [Carpinus fangiana]
METKAYVFPPRFALGLGNGSFNAFDLLGRKPGDGAFVLGTCESWAHWTLGVGWGAHGWGASMCCGSHCRGARGKDEGACLEVGDEVADTPQLGKIRAASNCGERTAKQWCGGRVFVQCETALGGQCGGGASARWDAGRAGWPQVGPSSPLAWCQNRAAGDTTFDGHKISSPLRGLTKSVHRRNRTVLSSVPQKQTVELQPHTGPQTMVRLQQTPRKGRGQITNPALKEARAPRLDCFPTRRQQSLC